VHLVNTTVPSNCTTKPPPTEQPVPAYIPDGSNGNEVFHRVDKTGDFFQVLLKYTDNFIPLYATTKEK
jgi:hypothetical protein